MQGYLSVWDLICTKMQVKEDNKMKKTKIFKPKVPVKMKNLTWAQSKVRFPHLKPYGDVDNDGVKNFRDCKPFDINRQGEEHKMTKDDYGFKFLYNNKKKKEFQSAQDLIDDLD